MPGVKKFGTFAGVFTPSILTILAPQKMLSSLVISISNTGTADLHNISALEAPFLAPWVTINHTNLGSLSPGQVTSFTVTADTYPAESGNLINKVFGDNAHLAQSPGPGTLDDNVNMMHKLT